jgi:type II secretory pathway component PulM
VTVFWGLWKPEAFIFKPEEAELERMRAEIAALEKRQEAAEEQVSHAAVTEVTSVSLLPNSSGAGWSVSLHDAWTARSELAD